MDIVERVINFESLDEKMHRLKRKVEILQSKEDDITEELEYAETLSVKKRRKEVDTWLKHVGILKDQVHQIEQEVQERRWYTYSKLQNRADQFAMEATELIQNGKFSEGLTLEACSGAGVSLLTRNLVGGMFEKNKHTICQLLMSDEGSIVGVYGMGGVGKTTLLTHIHNKLQNLPNAFVSWVTVSQQFSIFELQNLIAKEVKLNLSKDGCEGKRAAELARAISGLGKFILVLDDVWQCIPVDKVGIPIGANGVKLIFSTRSLEVCRRMNCQNTIKVEPLSHEEAWELFLETLGHNNSLPPRIEVIARSLVQTCDGLPLGVVTMAGCMRRVDDISEWSNALEKMEESKVEQEDMEIEVFRVLKYSYDSLKDRIVQQCFSYCSLFPEDCQIGRDELIEHLIDERLIDGMKSRQSKLNKGHTILNKLENVCLLEGGKYPQQNTRYVKMHDLIRDMAIQITSGSPRFLVKAGVGLRDMPEEKTWSEDLVRVSLMWNNIISLPSNASPRCPRLLTLLLNQNRIESIPYCFFMYMNVLTVLDLSFNSSIEQLPSSISNLRSLTALLLRGCVKLKYVPSLESLTALRRLDISFTEITELPQGIERSVNLRYLNLEATDKLEKVPHGVFSKLSNLEYLKLCVGRNPKFRAEEILSLRKLDTFTGCFYDIIDLNTCVSSWEDRGLSSYQLFMGEDFDCGHFTLIEYTIEKYVYLQMFNISKSKAGENSPVLPKDIQFLQIQECHDVTCLFDVALLENAIHLRMCKIVNCNGMKNLVGSSCCRLPLLQSLESLHLSKLFNLNDLIKGGVSISSTASSGIFHSLKECYVYKCHNLKSLFFPSLLLHLQQLETLTVVNCKQMVEVIGEASNEDEDQEARRIVVFSYLPKLKDLTLRDLPELKNFCSKSIVLANSLQQISVIQCPKLRRIPILCEKPYPLPSVQKIIVYEEWWNSLEWDYPHFKDFYQPFLSILGQQ
ncbi:hypothetical protein UlMin_004511 [Ulmus minor]